MSNDTMICKVEDDEFIPCGFMKDGLEYNAIKRSKFFYDSFVIGENPEMVLNFCPFCSEQI